MKYNIQTSNEYKSLIILDYYNLYLTKQDKYITKIYLHKNLEAMLDIFNRKIE